MDKNIIHLIKVNLQKQMEGEDILPICIAGKPGTGKTSTVRAIADELGAGFYNLSLPNTRLEQFSGIPSFDEVPEFSKYSVSKQKNPQGTTWSVPEVVVTANRLAEQNGSCVLLLDDFHELSSNKPVMAIMYEFLLERKLGDFKLHPKVAIITAMNDSEAAGFYGISSAINDRLSMLRVEYNHEYWMKHFGMKLNYLVSSFLKNNPQFAIESESTSVESAASPRSWTYMSNMIDALDSEFLISNLKTITSQFVSEEATENFKKHVAYVNSIDFTKIVKEERMQKVSALDFAEQMVWPYFINFIETPKNAAYAIELINLNQTDSQFGGLVAAELYVKFQQAQQGKPITQGQQILIDKFLGKYNPDDYVLSAKEASKLEDAKIEAQSELLAYASTYIQ